MNRDNDQTKSTTPLSRRELFKAGVAAGVAATLPSVSAHAAPHADENDSSAPVVFINGKIHTMDDQNRVVTSATIQNGRFTDVSKNSHGGHQAKEIDLRGRTVVPGLIESHTHFVSLANRPGYHVAQWELASSVAEVLAMLAARRRDVPAGQFITAMGAGTPRMFDEQRLPTLAEMDVAVPDRPVLL